MRLWDVIINGNIVSILIDPDNYSEDMILSIARKHIIASATDNMAAAILKRWVESVTVKQREIVNLVGANHNGEIYKYPIVNIDTTKLSN